MTPTTRLGRNPASRAAAGAEPTVRISKPRIERDMITQPTTATASDTRAPALTRVPSKRIGNTAESENMRDCGKFIPSGSFQGPSTR